MDPRADSAVLNGHFICNDAKGLVPDLRSSRGRRDEFLRLKAKAGEAYWGMACLLAIIDEAQDWTAEGFENLEQYSSAPVESGGLDTHYSSYDSLRRAIRNGRLWLDLDRRDVDTRLLVEAGPSKADIVRRHIPDSADSASITELFERAKRTGTRDLGKELKLDTGSTLDPEKEPEPKRRGHRVKVRCPECDHEWWEEI